jgi:hypothetical protein
MIMGSRTTQALGALLAAALAGCATISGAAPTGSEEKPSADDRAAMEAVGHRVKGTIVWSSSRLGNHDLFTMKTDGSDVKQITRGDAVDWFPRFSPDGSKILFCRSKKGWVSERDANNSDKWDLYTVAPDGTAVTKVVDSASWGSWLGNDEIIYVRGTKIFRSKLGSDQETELMDSAGVEALDGAQLQQPEMSHDGRFIAITLRGSKRETGIWNIEKKKWTPTGLGCQINWTPDGNSIYWVNPTGNGGSEVFRMPIKEGKPAKKEIADDELRFIDVPGRRSHEYFPELSVDGKWMVWGVTQRGHDHDIADYEIYIWEVATPPEGAVRLTFHSANDRWPDIFIPSATPVAAADSAPSSPAAAAASPPPAEEPAGDEKEEAAPDAPKAHATPKSKASKKAKKKGKKRK